MLSLNEFGASSKYIFNVWVREMKLICDVTMKKKLFLSIKRWAFDLCWDTRCENWKNLNIWAFLCKFVFYCLKKNQSALIEDIK